jgi:hypothetical protein
MLAIDRSAAMLSVKMRSESTAQVAIANDDVPPFADFEGLKVKRNLIG